MLFILKGNKESLIEINHFSILPVGLKLRYFKFIVPNFGC